MRRLDNYLGLTVAIMTLLASAGLISLFVIFTFLDQMSDIGQDYNLIAVIKYVSYSTVRRTDRKLNRPWYPRQQQ
jgi:lipopolysaccharide export LptBFGC system permease protein LptF